MGVDCYGTGEFLNDDAYMEHGSQINHYSAYNLTEAACRIQDILLAESYLAERFSAPPLIHGLAGAGGWVLLAHGLAQKSAKTIADLSGLDFTNDQGFVDEMMIPNIRRAGDFVTSIVLGRERPVEWHGLSDPVMEQRLKKASKRL